MSIIVPAYNEERVIDATTRSMLELDYPEHEVIVVNDGSTDGTLAALIEAFDLEPYQTFVRHVFPHNEVRAMYRCREHPNLVVVDKENGGKADALNAALNVARYRYVCGVDADTWFDRKALLKGMRLAVQDPARVIGVTSHMTTARKPEEAMAPPQGRADRPAPAHGIPASRLPPRLLQQPDGLVARQLHAVLAGGIRDLAARRARGGRRLLAASRARTSS